MIIQGWFEDTTSIAIAMSNPSDYLIHQYSMFSQTFLPLPFTQISVIPVTFRNSVTSLGKSIHLWKLTFFNQLASSYIPHLTHNVDKCDCQRSSSPPLGKVLVQYVEDKVNSNTKRQLAPAKCKATNGNRVQINRCDRD